MISETSDEVDGEKLTTTETQYVQYRWVKRGEVAPGCTQPASNNPSPHSIPGKDVVPPVASPELSTLSATNRDNDYGIVTMNDVRPCTPLLNNGGRSQALYGHVGMPGQNCVCARICHRIFAKLAMVRAEMIQMHKSYSNIHSRYNTNLHQL